MTDPTTKNRHYWNEVSAHDTLRWDPPRSNVMKCRDCGILTLFMAKPGEKAWRDRQKVWHAGSAPRCDGGG